MSLDDQELHLPGDSGGCGQSSPPGGAADAAQRCSKLYDPVPGSVLPAPGGDPQTQHHPAPPVAALAEGTPQVTPRPRRQARDLQGRTRDFHVRASEEEYAKIKARAEAAGVSIPRLLIELAVLGPAGAPERNVTKATMLGVRRQIIGMATNLNQLAKWANARKQLPPGLEASLAAVQRMEAQVAALVRDLGAQRR